jgi:hypothetical protein
MTLHLANGLWAGGVSLVLNFGIIAVNRAVSRRCNRQRGGAS